MNFRLAICGAIWAAILAIALQLVPAPAFAHAGHTHHAGDVSALAHHQHGGEAFHQKAAPPAAQPGSLAANLSAMPEPSENLALASPCAGGCCGAGAGCCGAALVGSTTELPDIGTTVRGTSRIVDRRSGVDPDGLARPPRTLAA
jgi:hypothetical protein